MGNRRIYAIRVQGYKILLIRKEGVASLEEIRHGMIGLHEGEKRSYNPFIDEYGRKGKNYPSIKNIQNL